MKRTSFPCVLASIAALAGCHANPESVSSRSPDPKWSAQPEPLLYARDGSVVGAPGDGGSARETPRHEVGARDGSRMYLLELYQKTVEERDGLARELETHAAALTRASETQAALVKERDEARAEALKLRGELEAGRRDNDELAARLVTAQIRRLEAEKLLLEARIESLRGAPVAGAPKSPERE